MKIAQNVPIPASDSEQLLAFALTKRIDLTVVGPDDALADWAHGCDVLVCECSLPASMAIKEHLTPDQCASLAARARPGHVVLTHFYPPVERVDIRATVAAQYSGPVTLGRDGWHIDLEG